MQQFDKKQNAQSHLTSQVLIWVLAAFLKEPFVPEFTGKLCHMNEEPHLFTRGTGCAK